MHKVPLTWASVVIDDEPQLPDWAGFLGLGDWSQGGPTDHELARKRQRLWTRPDAEFFEFHIPGAPGQTAQL